MLELTPTIAETQPGIPEDLREDYEHYRKYHKCASRADVLIERIGRAEASLREMREALQDAERALFLASNEPELRPMMPDAWVARWMGKVAAFRESEVRAAALEATK